MTSVKGVFSGSLMKDSCHFKTNQNSALNSDFFLPFEELTGAACCI